MPDEPTTISSAPGRRRRRTVTALLSIAAHLALFAGLLASAAWKVEKLEPDDPPLTMAAGFAPSPPAAADEAPEPAHAPAHHRVHHTGRVQPHQAARASDAPADEQESDDQETGGADTSALDSALGGGANPFGVNGPCAPGQPCSTSDHGSAPVCGNGRVEDGEQCDDGNQAAGDGCSSRCTREQPPRVVVAHLIEGQRIAGNPQIAAPESVRAVMQRQGARRAVGSIEMCLSRTGAVSNLKLLRSTGYPEYDSALIAGMRTWRYRPYRLDSGAAVPVCTVVTFVYRLP